MALVGIALCATVHVGAAQDAVEAPKFRAGIKLYIEKMAGDLDGFLRAEMMKKNVPVVIVLDEARVKELEIDLSPSELFAPLSGRYRRRTKRLTRSR